MGAAIRAGSNYDQHQIPAAPICWPGFEQRGLYCTTPSYSSQSGASATLPISIVTGSDQQFSTWSFDVSPTSSASLLSLSAPVKKKPTSVPENLKNEAYRERRIRNNESARKSRELRRQKEQSTQYRCNQLLHENHLLKAKLSLLRSQMEHFRQFVSVSSNASHQTFITFTSVHNP